MKNCPICNKKLKDKQYLTQHMESHKKKIFQCSLCDRTCRTAKALMNHELIHSNLRPYACFVCGKGFTTKAIFVGHLRIHDPDRPKYSCEVCSRTFFVRKDMMKHVKSHTVIKPSACTGNRDEDCSSDDDDELLNFCLKGDECILCGILLKEHVALKPFAALKTRSNQRETQSR